MSNIYLLLCLSFLLLSPLSADSFVYTDRSSSVELTKPSQEESFSFAIFGNRTVGVRSGLAILEKAVDEVNTLRPDFVVTVGDMTDGDNNQQWHEETNEYLKVMRNLTVPWFPTAGNNDVCWSGAGRPENEHESDYEKFFGPLWYAFEHKDCWFIFLYSDEGDPDTGKKSYRDPEAQVLSPKQTSFLINALEKAQDAKHVFIFIHHPRWTGGRYGHDWVRIHKILKDAGNVSACFAGQSSLMKYYGRKDNIEYYTLSVTGGNLSGNFMSLNEGNLQQFNLVTVRGNKFYVGAFPVGYVINPKADAVTTVLLPEEGWHVADSKSRSLPYRIHIPPYKGTGTIKIGLAHGADDSGDHGATYKLLDWEDNIIMQGFSKRKDYEWIRYPVQPGQDYFFRIEDKDTSLSGGYPGNGGKIKIELEVIKN